MKTLRERIEDTVRYSPGSAGKMVAKDDGRWIPRLEILRIVAEHEQAQAPVLGMTPGGPVNVTAPPVGQAGEKHRRLSDFRAADHECGADGQLCLYPVQIPVELIRMHAVWESATGLLVHAIDLCDPRYAGRCFRPWKSSWSDVEQMARDADGGAK